MESKSKAAGAEGGGGGGGGGTDEPDTSDPVVAEIMARVDIDDDSDAESEPDPLDIPNVKTAVAALPQFQQDEIVHGSKIELHKLAAKQIDDLQKEMAKCEHEVWKMNMAKRDLTFEVERVTSVAARLQGVIERNKREAVRSDMVEAVSRFWAAKEKLRHVDVRHEGFVDWWKHATETLAAQPWDGVTDTAAKQRLVVNKTATGRRPQHHPVSRAAARAEEAAREAALEAQMREEAEAAQAARRGSQASMATVLSHITGGGVGGGGDTTAPHRRRSTRRLSRGRRLSKRLARRLSAERGGRTAHSGGGGGSDGGGEEEGGDNDDDDDASVYSEDLRDEEAWSGAVRLGAGGRGFVEGMMEFPKHGTWTIRITVTKPNPLEVNRFMGDTSGGNTRDNVSVMLGSSPTSMSTIARVFNVRAPGRADAVHFLR